MAKTRRQKSKRLYGGNQEHGPDTVELMNRIRTMSSFLDLGDLNITSLPPLPSNTTYLILSKTQVTSLPESLPPNLEGLDISDTRITRLPKLPGTLQLLFLRNTQVTSLPELPANLQQLSINNTGITQLPALPGSLFQLNISNSGVTRLPEPLPHHLAYLDVAGTPMTSLPTILPYLRTLDVSNTRIGRLPELPPTLTRLNTDNTSIEPMLPNETPNQYNKRMIKSMAKQYSTAQQTLLQPSDDSDNSALGKLRRSNILPNLLPEMITGKKEKEQTTLPKQYPTIMQELKKKATGSYTGGRTKKRRNT